MPLRIEETTMPTAMTGPDDPRYPAVTEDDMHGPHDPGAVLPGDVDLETDDDETDEDDDAVEDETDE